MDQVREVSGRVCVTCRQRKPWSAFAKGKTFLPHKYCINCGHAPRKPPRTQPPSHHQYYKFGLSPKEYRNIFIRVKPYKISVPEFLNLVTQQEGKCLICAVYQGRKLCIDHDHTSGRVRGLLCYSCNSGLGQFKDKPNLLTRAAQYLVDHNLTKQRPEDFS